VAPAGEAVTPEGGPGTLSARWDVLKKALPAAYAVENPSAGEAANGMRTSDALCRCRPAVPPLWKETARRGTSDKWHRDRAFPASQVRVFAGTASPTDATVAPV